MYLLLPPSETKRPGGGGAPLALDGLPFPALAPIRSRLVDALAAISVDRPAARAALRISDSMDGELAANVALRSAPTLPALRRYDGVLYGALQTPAMSRAELSRAEHRLLICSALFGLLEATSPVPAYRLSAGSRLPGIPGIAALWRPSVTTELAALEEPVVDLRSGAYAAFGRPAGAIEVRVVRPGPNGTVLAVSHDNKATKGRFARLLATSRAELGDLTSVLRLAYRAGWTARRSGSHSIDVYA